MGRKKGYVEFEESPPDEFDPANPYKHSVARNVMRTPFLTKIQQHTLFVHPFFPLFSLHSLFSNATMSITATATTALHHTKGTATTVLHPLSQPLTPLSSSLSLAKSLSTRSLSCSVHTIRSHEHHLRPPPPPP
ncbi:NADH dehydrogenase (ubiquinone) 1 beta subcomplex [Trifolium medium]|uniref:NADH dehydrogenase (Ubiquinone) 1 beta subcomplex n=1 Tax=Trifolium medium TaxID=97028 RepID=A0A392LYY7_9FABA|nr:NADH dehydrogenase (ubiquinone) 1 beta subcomplex [Trifolium medium]